MPYIKISDPNIIDLAAWHQVINVVNQHSDSITAITNNFGVKGTGTEDWNTSANLTHEMDPGSQKILYGKIKVDTATASSKANDEIFYGDINFDNSTTGAVAFSAKPIVTVTPQFGYQGGEPPSTNAGVICTIYNIQIF